MVYPYHGILLSNQKEKFIHGAILMDLREENDAECHTHTHTKKKKTKKKKNRPQKTIGSYLYGSLK